MLAEALPNLIERTDVNQVHTDGGYNSPKVDELMREHQIVQIQTAIRGRKPPQYKLGLDDFHWETDAQGRPQTLTCPRGQHVVEPTIEDVIRNEDRTLKTAVRYLCGDEAKKH